MLKLLVSTLLFITGIARAELVQEGNYKLVSDTCYDKKGHTEQACDPSWKTSIQEIKITFNRGLNPLDGSIHVVPVKQTIPSQIYADGTYPVADYTVPNGYFSNNSIMQTSQVTYVYESVAWVSNRYVGEDKAGQLRFEFNGNRLIFSVIGVSLGLDQQVDRKIRKIVFEK